MPVALLQSMKAGWMSYQASKRSWSDWNYLVLDLETSGLDAKQNHIVSVGWVCVQNGVIELDTARHIVIENTDVGDSVGIHMITDSDIELHGKKRESVLRYLRHLLRDRILVMHHAPMELSFLKQSWQEEKLPAFSVDWLDTLAIERTRANRTQQPIQDGGFRLGACRERYGLPDYEGHDALTDALATAELLLAQVAYQGASCHLHDLNQMGGGKARFTSR
jgi:DNA polymerase-3 subunit epsilon